MPGMDGYETTQKIREYIYLRGEPQPIISAVTGHMEQIYIDKAINHGMNQVMGKPVNTICLADLIKKLGYSTTKKL